MNKKISYMEQLNIYSFKDSLGNTISHSKSNLELLIVKEY